MLEGWLVKMELQVLPALPGLLERLEARGLKGLKVLRALLDLKETQGLQVLRAHKGQKALKGRLVQQAQLVLALAMVTQKATSSTGMDLDGRTWL